MLSGTSALVNQGCPTLAQAFGNESDAGAEASAAWPGQVLDKAVWETMQVGLMTSGGIKAVLGTYMVGASRAGGMLAAAGAHPLLPADQSCRSKPCIPIVDIARMADMGAYWMPQSANFRGRMQPHSYLFVVRGPPGGMARVVCCTREVSTRDMDEAGEYALRSPDGSIKGASQPASAPRKGPANCTGSRVTRHAGGSEAALGTAHYIGGLSRPVGRRQSARCLVAPVLDRPLALVYGGHGPRRSTARNKGREGAQEMGMGDAGLPRCNVSHNNTRGHDVASPGHRHAAQTNLSGHAEQPDPTTSERPEAARWRG